MRLQVFASARKQLSPQDLDMCDQYIRFEIANFTRQVTSKFRGTAGCGPWPQWVHKMLCSKEVVNAFQAQERHAVLLEIREIFLQHETNLGTDPSSATASCSATKASKEP